MITDGIYTADKIFTGEEWLYNHAIVVNNGQIADVIPVSQILVPATKHFACLIPAFIDIQIYGAAEKLLAVYPTTEALALLHDYCLKGKTHNFLPTVATNSYKVIYDCINAVKAYWQQGGEGCLGLHIEGPWINTEKRGAHVASLIHTPTIEEVTELIEYGKGVIKMITLAPEICNKEIVEQIQSYGIIVSAGHSNATYEQATSSFNNGITTVTHLYNAMSGLQHREPGMVGAVLNHSNVMASIIPDGYHVNFAAIQVAKKIMKERLFVITDAVTATTSGYYQHNLTGDKYESNNILSGSALTMEKAALNLVNHCGIELEEAFRMCSLYPARVLGLDNKLGKIKKEYRASFVECGNI
jgi:N-acetylglucosamine-6-phosphate deacetylase